MAESVSGIVTENIKAKHTDPDIAELNKAPTISQELLDEYEDAAMADEGAGQVMSATRSMYMANPQVNVTDNRDMVREKIKQHLKQPKVEREKFTQVKGYSTKAGAPVFTGSLQGLGHYQDGQFVPSNDVLRDKSSKGGSGGGKGRPVLRDNTEASMRQYFKDSGFTWSDAGYELVRNGTQKAKDFIANANRQKSADAKDIDDAKPSDSTTSALAGLDASYQLTDELMAAKQGVNTGPWAGRAQDWGQAILGDLATTPEFQDLQQKSGSLMANITKQLSGTAVNKAELAKLEKFIPTYKMDDEQFNRAVKNFKHQLKVLMDSTVKRQTDAGKKFGGTESKQDKPTANPKIQQAQRWLQSDAAKNDPEKAAKVRAKLESLGVK